MDSAEAVAGLVIALVAMETVALVLATVAVVSVTALLAAPAAVAMAAEVAIGEALSIDGGLSRSPYFAQFLADALGRDIRTRAFDELTSLGCAALAGLALGVELPERAGGDMVYASRDHGRDRWQGRFEQAVARSRGWR